MDEGAAKRLLDTYGPFAATERVLMEVARRGASRQDMHEVIREQSMVAWAALKRPASPTRWPTTSPTTPA